MTITGSGLPGITTSSTVGKNESSLVAINRLSGFLAYEDALIILR